MCHCRRIPAIRLPGPRCTNLLTSALAVTVDRGCVAGRCTTVRVRYGPGRRAIAVAIVVGRGLGIIATVAVRVRRIVSVAPAGSVVVPGGR